MSSEGSRRKLIALALLLVVLAVLVVAFKAYRDSQFRLVSTDPSVSSINNNDTYMALNFNRHISLSGFGISSSNGFVTKFVQSGSESIRLSWQKPLIVGNTYSITIGSISSLEGKSLNNLKVSFIPKAFNLNGLNKSQQAQAINGQDKATAADPIYKILPYYSPYFELQAQPNGQNRPSILFIYLPPPVGQSGPTEQQAYSDAETWLTQNGINLSNYSLVTEQ